jgi:hypothetical protein
MTPPPRAVAVGSTFTAFASFPDPVGALKLSTAPPTWSAAPAPKPIVETRPSDFAFSFASTPSLFAHAPSCGHLSFASLLLLIAMRPVTPPTTRPATPTPATMNPIARCPLPSSSAVFDSGFAGSVVGSGFAATAGSAGSGSSFGMTTSSFSPSFETEAVVVKGL